MRRVALGVLLTALPVLLPAGSAEASPQDLFGVGGRTPAMANTGASHADGFEAAWANPAGLSATRHYGLFLGAQAGSYQLSLDGQPFALAPSRGIPIGFALPLPFGDVLEDRLVFGGFVYTPAEALLAADVRFIEVPQWPVLDRSQRLAIHLGLGVALDDVLEGLSVGGGVSALSDLVGEIDAFLDETNAFQSLVETQLLATFAPVVGVRLRRDRWGVGVSYRHELFNRIDLEIRTADLPIELPVLQVGGVTQYEPPHLAVEGHLRPLDELMIVANLTTRFWSAYPGPQIATTGSSLLAPAPGFSTVLSPRVAVEGGWRNDRFHVQLRGGYAFEPTPAPTARLAPRRRADGSAFADPDPVPARLIDNERHTLTVGAGLTAVFSEDLRLRLDGYAQLHLLVDRTHEVGRSSTDGAPMVSGGAMVAGGWTLGLEYR
jgi:hypothetical protein